MAESFNLWSKTTDTATPSTPADQTASQPPTQGQEVADLLYRANSRPMPGRAPGELYGPTQLAGEIDRRTGDLLAIGMSEAAQRERRAGLLDLTTQDGVPESILVKIHRCDTDDLIAAARPVADADDMSTENAARYQAQATESRDALHATYGVERAEELIARTIRYCKARPALWALLSRNGVGSRKEIACELVAHVHSTGWNG